MGNPVTVLLGIVVVACLCLISTEGTTRKRVARFVPDSPVPQLRRFPVTRVPAFRPPLFPCVPDRVFPCDPPSPSRTHVLHRRARSGDGRTRCRRTVTLVFSRVNCSPGPRLELARSPRSLLWIRATANSVST